MNLRINVNSVGTNLAEVIEAKLKENMLPSCFGNMIPPTLYRVIDVDDTIVATITESAAPDEIHDVDISKYLDQEQLPDVAEFIADKSLTKKGVENIERYKKNVADEYVHRLKECSECAYTDTCYKLTKNFMSLMSLQENLNN